MFKAKLTILVFGTVGAVSTQFPNIAHAGCAAQGCAQVFAVTGNDNINNGALTRYSAITSTATSPSLKISSGWIATPIGLTNLGRSGTTLYIETGSTKDCRYGCDRIYAYNTAYDGSNVTDTADRSTFWTDSTLQRTYTVRYTGSNNWQASWCDGQLCRSFAPVPLGQGQGYTFAAAGGESSSPSNYFGSIQFKNNRYVNAGATQYIPFCWSFSVKNNFTQGSLNSLGSCISYGWSVNYSLSGFLSNFFAKDLRNTHLYGNNIYASKKQSSILKSDYSLKKINYFLQSQASTENKFDAKSLLNASDQEVTNAALEWTRISFDVTDTPKVVLIRSVTIEDLSKLGLSEAAGIDAGKPLKLVVVKGSFDLSNIRGGFSSKKGKLKASYVGYVFDLEAGVPISTLTAKNGGRFRKALNQPNLPDDAQPDDQGLNKGNSPEAVPVPLPAL
jgi:hypothetical protein